MDTDLFHSEERQPCSPARALLPYPDPAGLGAKPSGPRPSGAVFSREPGLRDAHFSPVLMRETKPYKNEKKTSPCSGRRALRQREPVARRSRFSPKQRGKAGVRGQNPPELGAKPEERRKFSEVSVVAAIISQRLGTFGIGELRLKGTKGDSALPALRRWWTLVSKGAFVQTRGGGRRLSQLYCQPLPVPAPGSSAGAQSPRL